MLAGVSEPHRSTAFQRGRPVEWLLFMAATLLSAFLLFLVQPLVAKHILPWFGGAPAVWNVCMAFYQSALFAGYLYAHVLITRVPPPRQLWIHGALVVTAFALLPVLPAESWRPDGASDPGLQIFMMLISSVALPFIALAGTVPIVQALFAKRFPGTSPYPLYALSNFGSLLALLCFPFALEPWVSVSVASPLCQTCQPLRWTSMALRADPRLASSLSLSPPQPPSAASPGTRLGGQGDRWPYRSQRRRAYHAAPPRATKPAAVDMPATRP